MSTFMSALISLIKIHEGFRSKVYADEYGNKTIGYGHELTSVGIPYSIPLSLEDGEALLEHDVGLVLSWIQKYSWWESLTDNRKICLVDLAFNVGEEGFQKFKHMISDLENSDYSSAAAQLKNSEWYSEVGSRAINDYELLLKG